MPSITFTRRWQIVKKVLHVLSQAHGSVEPVGEGRQKKGDILDLPTELLLKIFSYLSLPTQVCLTLSSKRLNQLFNCVLGSKELRFPQMPHREQAYVVTEEYNLRMTLLTQLENETWACCGRCQRLHPCAEFPKRQLMDSRPWERTCMPYAGIVDLCPCISLTLRDRTRIVEYLKAPKSNKPSLNLINRGILSKRPSKQYLLHECTAYPRVRIEMRLSLTGSEQLTTSTQYMAPNFDHPWREMDDTMPLCCSKVWIDALVPHTTSPWSCRNCHARIVNLIPSHAEVVVMNVVRFLGRGIWFTDCKSDSFEKQWYNQCRDLGDYIPT